MSLKCDMTNLTNFCYYYKILTAILYILIKVRKESNNMKELKKLLKKKQYENIIKALLSLNDEAEIDKAIRLLKKKKHLWIEVVNSNTMK